MKTDFARQQMVEQQVRAVNVLDLDSLDVLADLPREQFVPPGYESLAFADTEIPIGHGECMMTPTIEGRVLQALDLQPNHRVLEVGTGTGFLAACLARLCDSVVSIDIHDEFLKSAAANLEDSGIGNVEVQKMNAMRTLPDEPFDAIAVTGSIESFDPRFVMALKPGGVLFVVVGTDPVMEALRVERTSDTEWESTVLFETSLRPLVDGALPPQFSF